MKQIKILTYILDNSLSNKYLNIIIQCLKPMISNEKGDVLFGFFIKIKPQLSHLITKTIKIV